MYQVLWHWNCCGGSVVQLCGHSPAPDSSTVCDTAAGLSCPYITKGFLQVRIPLLSCTLRVSAVSWETA